MPCTHATWFRGRDTTTRAVSRCPDETCCRRPPADLADGWGARAWPSAHLHAHVLAPLSRGDVPGVDDTEVYAFLDARSD